MVIRVGLYIFCFPFVLLMSGCSVPGRLYTNITEPLTENFASTSVGAKKCILRDYSIQEPISGYNVAAEWTSDVIIAAAQEAGITNICYMDQHTFSIFSGVYKKTEVIVYGN